MKRNFAQVTNSEEEPVKAIASARFNVANWANVNRGSEIRSRSTIVSITEVGGGRGGSRIVLFNFTLTGRQANFSKAGGKNIKDVGKLVFSTNILQNQTVKEILFYFSTSFDAELGCTFLNGHWQT